MNAIETQPPINEEPHFVLADSQPRAYHQGTATPKDMPCTDATTTNA